LPDSDWKCLALAQHYGLATRLLDWSWNPLVALFLVATDDDTEDGGVYAWPFAGLLGERFSEVHDVRTYEPPPFDRRIAAQQGVFTYHPRPTEP
jgi:FRG domain